MANKDILLASSNIDKANFGEVRRQLIRRGYRVIVYEPDSIAHGKLKFNARINQQGQFTFQYDCQAFPLEGFVAGWCRRPNFYRPYKDKIRWLVLKEEYRTLQDALWEIIPQSIWLNAPQAMRKASIKLPQLMAAAKLGFHIPETVVSNSWETIESLKYNKLLVKMSQHLILPSQNGDIGMPSTILKRNELPKQAIPYPGLWQPYVKKKREWRITVVGDQVFSAAIYTKKDARDDWRKHQFTSKVVFKAENFPEEEQKKCKALLKHFDLRYGAFDFIETPEGEIVFLEVNPNGQFMWLEEDLGLPISEAIVNELIVIASRH